MSIGSELGRQIAVDLEPDADFDKRWGGPDHVHPPLVLATVVATVLVRR